MNLNITKYNYEAYILDYLEGSLSQAEQLALRRFLDDNPLIRKEVEKFTIITLPKTETPIFPDKSNLYKTDKRIRVYPNWLSVAAIVLVLVGLSFIWVYLNNPSQIATDGFVRVQRANTLNIGGIDLVTIDSVKKSISSVKNKEQRPHLAITERPLINSNPENPIHLAKKKIADTKEYSDTAKKATRHNLISSHYIEEKETRVILESERSINEISLREPTSQDRIIQKRELVIIPVITKAHNKYLVSTTKAKTQIELDLKHAESISIEKRKLFGNWAFANTRISILPSYVGAE